MNAEQLVKFAARRAETLFRRQKRIVPLYQYVRADGSQGLFVQPPWCQSKDDLVAYAKAIFKQENAVAYVFLNEVWTYVGPHTMEEADRLLAQYGGTLENVPGRTEHILAMGEDENGMVYGRMEIHRPPGREPYLGSLEIDRPEGMEGRMVGLLPLRGVKQ